tara:strand:- start:3905 stop:4165 length:261 start_codon:yes stop_codon:yes gene_type:complete
MENLKAKMTGGRLTNRQKTLAIKEFEDLLDHVNDLERELLHARDYIENLEILNRSNDAFEPCPRCSNLGYIENYNGTRTPCSCYYD